MILLFAVQQSKFSLNCLVNKGQMLERPALLGRGFGAARVVRVVGAARALKALRVLRVARVARVRDELSPRIAQVVPIGSRVVEKWKSLVWIQAARSRRAKKLTRGNLEG